MGNPSTTQPVEDREYWRKYWGRQYSQAVRQRIIPTSPPEFLTEAERQRWSFIRWLVWTGWISDWQEDIDERIRDQLRQFRQLIQGQK